MSKATLPQQKDIDVALTKEEKKMKKITLCGSTKFKDTFLEFNKLLTLQGNIVYSVSCFGHADDIPLTAMEKELLDKVHKAKIDNSDEIFVLDVNKYIGYSTQSEIAHALETGKGVRYMSIEYPNYKDPNEHFPACRESGKCVTICALCYDLL